MRSDMNRCVALIRGINVGGNSIIRMTDLKALFESADLKDVSTYIQSGNVIFTSDIRDKSELVRKLEALLKPAAGSRAKVLILSKEELEKAQAGNPFEPEKHDREQKTHLMFLSDVPNEANIRSLMEKQGLEYRFHVKDKVLYYTYPNEYAANRRTIDFEKILGVYGTSRSWKVVHKLIEMF